MKFSISAYNRACDEYERNWQATDEPLYRLCREYPRHDDRAGTAAKLWIIGRAYATGIERAIKTTGAQSSALKQLIDYFCSKHAQIDRLINELPAGRGPLTGDKLRQITSVHGRFVNVLRGVVRSGRTPRAFASKYLHFHCPAVPIYDSVASKSLAKLVRWRNNLQVFAIPREADPTYGRFVLRLFHLNEAIRVATSPPTAKELDYYLLSVADNGSPQVVSKSKARIA